MKTVLAVEDNRLNRELIKKLIELNHYNAITAETAEAAFEIIKKTRPDLILMDIDLPGMDGLSATKKLKNDACFRDIPVIALSAYAMQDDKDKAIKAGCTDYIVKPIDLKIFSGTLNKYLV
ncbi:MAG: response regulator [Spirochaetes bacterium]|nr:response regulator [Spirochaetota bacterium]